MENRESSSCVGKGSKKYKGEGITKSERGEKRGEKTHRNANVVTYRVVRIVVKIVVIIAIVIVNIAVVVIIRITTVVRIMLLVQFLLL